MCGIIYTKNLKGNNAKDLLIETFNNQKSRGVEGFGFIAIDKKGNTTICRAEDEQGMLDLLKDHATSEILFHHRYPTSTPNFIVATHPIFVSHDSLKYDYYVVHNGVLTNEYHLKSEHKKRGFVYTTSIKKFYKAGNEILNKQKFFNDSESFAIELALALEEDKEIDARGSIAFMALRVEKKTGKALDLFWGRNDGNPLIMKRTKNTLTISSENKYGGVKINTNTLYHYNYRQGRIIEREFEVGSYSYPKSYSYGGYGFSGVYDTDEEKSYLPFSEEFTEEEDGIRLSVFEDEEQMEQVIAWIIQYEKHDAELIEAIRLNDYDQETAIRQEMEEIQDFVESEYGIDIEDKMALDEILEAYAYTKK